MQDPLDLDHLSEKRRQTLRRLSGCKQHLEASGEEPTAIAIARVSAHVDEEGEWHAKPRVKRLTRETVGRYRGYLWPSNDALTPQQSRQKIKRLESELAECHRTCAGLRRELSASQLTVATLRNTIAELTSTIAEMRKRYGTWIRDWWETLDP